MIYKVLAEFYWQYPRQPPTRGGTRRKSEYRKKIRAKSFFRSPFKWKNIAATNIDKVCN